MFFGLYWACSHLYCQKMKRILMFLKRRLVPLFFFITIVYFMFMLIKPAPEISRKETLNKIDEVIKRHASVRSCKHPDLPVDAPEIMKHIVHSTPITCNSVESDWVTVKGSVCSITEEARQKHGAIKCSFTNIIRNDDHYLSDGLTTHVKDNYKLIDSDVVRVKCHSEDNHDWESVLVGIRHNDSILKHSSWSRKSQEMIPVNILMFGFDSLSRNTFIRKLPKSYDYLVNTLGAVILKGYNIVGDGTPQALIPILTGKTELELPETRKRIRDANYVNVYPFIWNEFSSSGYVTAFLEDLPATGIFTYRLKGFQNPPTDHYMRPYYLAASKMFAKSPKFCAGSTPRHKIMLNYIEQFFSAYKDKPKFLFGFHGELSHDSYNLIGAADDDTLEWLKNMKSNGVMNNTIFIFMADHGHRFAEVRNTVQGKQEERLPFFSFVLPEWFKVKYPEAFHNLKENADRLTTPFDIFSTFKHLFYWRTPTRGDLKQRSLSLFDEIPSERSCADAYIEPHWCACLDWQDIPIKSLITNQLADHFVQTLNNISQSHRHLCHPLSLSQILWVKKLSPNDNLLRFRKNADYDGFVADLSGHTIIVSDLYQIKIETWPGKGLYEASITHYFKNGKMVLKESDISRINMYGAQAKCIETDFPHLRKYCYCLES